MVTWLSAGLSELTVTVLNNIVDSPHFNQQELFMCASRSAQPTVRGRRPRTRREIPSCRSELLDENRNSFFWYLPPQHFLFYQATTDTRCDGCVYQQKKCIRVDKPTPSYPRDNFPPSFNLFAADPTILHNFLSLATASVVNQC